MNTRKKYKERSLPTKSEGLSLKQLYETYRAILIKDSREGSVLQRSSELENITIFNLKSKCN